MMIGGASLKGIGGALLLMTISSIARGDPIEILGINWTMSKHEMAAEFQRRGYECDGHFCFRPAEEVTNYYAHIMGADREWIAQLYTFNQVEFGCGFFNGCGSDDKTVALALTKQGIAGEFSYRGDLATTMRAGVFGMGEIKPRKTEALCYEGELGDYLCILDNDGFPEIILGGGDLIDNWRMEKDLNAMDFD